MEEGDLHGKVLYFSNQYSKHAGLIGEMYNHFLNSFEIKVEKVHSLKQIYDKLNNQEKIDCIIVDFDRNENRKFISNYINLKQKYGVKIIGTYSDKTNPNIQKKYHKIGLDEYIPYEQIHINQGIDLVTKLIDTTKK